LGCAAAKALGFAGIEPGPDGLGYGFSRLRRWLPEHQQEPELQGLVIGGSSPACREAKRRAWERRLGTKC